MDRVVLEVKRGLSGTRLLANGEIQHLSVYEDCWRPMPPNPESIALLLAHYILQQDAAGPAAPAGNDSVTGVS